MAAIDLCTLAQVKSFLGETTTSNDSRISEIITEVSLLIYNEADRRFALETYTEYADFRDHSRELYVRNYPIASVASVNPDSQRLWGSNTELVEDVDFVVVSSLGLIQLAGVSSSYPVGYKTVKVVYSGGYATVPVDIRYAAVLWSARNFRRELGEDFDRQSLTLPGGQSAAMLVDDPPMPVKNILLKYRRVYAH